MKRRFSISMIILCLILLNCIRGQLLYPSKTKTNQLIARDDDHNNDDKSFSNSRDYDDDKDKDKKNSPQQQQQQQRQQRQQQQQQQQVTTEINVIYTTIIYTSASTVISSAAATSSPLPSVYNVSNSGSAHQEQQPQQASPSASTNLDDPNKKDLQQNIAEDQQALKRMIMILSLVGGLGVIAVVATIVIFTRMRVKNRKQREIDEEGNEGSTFELSADVDRQSNSNTSESDNNDDNEGRGGQGVLLASAPTSNSSNVSISSTSSSLANGRTLTEPSAPPALMMIDGLEPLHRNRRNVVSMSSQTTAPSPSAPTAKELDAMEEDNNNIATTSTSYNHHILHHGHHHHQQEQINNCSRCTPMMMAPELPPPAYTPSAPPHYALPIEANVMEASPSSSSSSNMSPLPSRRHSLGG